MEACTDEGETPEFGVNLRLFEDAGGSEVGLTFKRVLAPLRLRSSG